MAVETFLTALDNSVKVRVQALSRTIINYTRRDDRHSSPKANVAILFSGGIDSTVISYLADR